MIINLQEYRSKVLGCWLGKNIGGTLGEPFEWRRHINDVSFYTQDLQGAPRPNDDLDIQLLWLIALEEKGVAIDAHVLAQYWLLYLTPHFVEYGTSKANMRLGLQPPLCGALNNIYKDSCGAFIRSEIWACIAPGHPRVAARYAYEDAILDHGGGEGVYAAIFTATLESAAFVVQDIERLIEIGLSYIPEDCGVAGAIRCAVQAHRSGKTWVEARDEVLRRYRSGLQPQYVSARDREMGFADGQQGWDAPMNIGMVIIALLYGEGDFGRSLCTAVNCGEDTDCTAATVGSIFGLLHGAQGIPQEWIEPIGRKIKTVCLNLGDLGHFGSQVPQDVDGLTERTGAIARRVILQHNLPLEISADGATDLTGVTPETLQAGAFLPELYANLGCPVYRFDSFDVAVDYGDLPYILDACPKQITLRIRSRDKVQTNLRIRCYAPEGWRVQPSGCGTVFVSHAWIGQDYLEVPLRLEVERVQDAMNRLVVELVIDARPATMLVPVTLLNGNWVPAAKPCCGEVKA